MVACLNPNLVLVGFMGTGKSTIGRRCARALSFRFVDTDMLVERRAGTSIVRIFAQQGEAAFRAMEREAVRESAARVHVVIATGGGVVLDAENVRLLRQSGIVVWLQVSPEEIARRCRNTATRPLLAEAENPLERIRRMLEVRVPYYEAAADAVVETTGVTHREAALRVLEAYRQEAARWTGCRQPE